MTQDRRPRRTAVAVGLLCGILLAAAGCQEDGPLRAWVIGYTAPHRLGLVQVELQTIEDLARLEGRAARFLGGAGITLDHGQIQAALDEAAARGEHFGSADLVRLVLRDEGEPVRMAWVEQGGAVYPEDYDSLAMLTAYYYLERGWLALQRSPGGPFTMAALRAFFEPTYTDTEQNQLGLPLLDNAMYFAPARSFVLLAGQELQRVPLPVNPGVVLHEYEHAVFDQLVFGGEFAAHLLRGGQKIKDINLLRSFDEGSADFFAAALSGDPAFVGQSFPALAGARDVSEVRTYDPELEAAAAQEQYDPYPLGSVWASALWTIGLELGQGQVVELLLAALSQAGAQLSGFGVLTLPELLVLAAPGKRAKVCKVLQDRFAAATWPEDSACLTLIAQPEAGE
ncbi:MAG: hypothetical protein FJ125_02750 [Deltaproteobacteria bacterium]|nr:hypothetical protein [Deltaproteobacteria bacterium]